LVEDVTAVLAFELADQALINGFTNLGASKPTGSAASQTAKQGAGDATEGCTNRTGDRANDGTSARASKDGGSSVEGSGDQASRAPDLARDVAAFDMCALATGALGFECRHTSPWFRQQKTPVPDGNRGCV
jgi:hypothetical protein